MKTPSAKSHQAYLDGFRALAALWVVLSHLWIGEFGISAHPGLLGVLTNWTLYSHLAVDIFIVLSGFCLILPITQADGFLKGGALAFFGRRARRILPPYYAALALSIVVFVLVQVIASKPPHIPMLALAANIFLLQDVFLPLNVFNGPFWSIAVEWRIYFFFPLIVLAARRWGWVCVLLGASLLSMGLTAALFRWHPEMILTCPWYLLLFTVSRAGTCWPSAAPGPATAWSAPSRTPGSRCAIASSGYMHKDSRKVWTWGRPSTRLRALSARWWEKTQKAQGEIRKSLDLTVHVSLITKDPAQYQSPRPPPTPPASGMAGALR